MRFNPWRGAAELPGRMWVVFAATLINRSGTMALPFLVLYLTRSLGHALTSAGLAITVYGLGSLVAAPVAGWLSDRFGRLSVVQGSLIASGILLAALPAFQSFRVLLALTFLWALVGEAYRPASSAFISDLVSADQRKIAFAVYRLAANLGMSVGPLLGGFLATRGSYSSLFWVDGATSTLAGLLFAAARGAGQTRPNEGSLECSTDATTAAFATNSVPNGAKATQAWIDPRLLYFLAAILPVAMVFFQFEGAMPLFMVRELRLAESVYGAMFLVNTMLIIFIEVPLNLATTGWPHHRVLALGALLTGLGFGGLALVTGAMGVAATIVVWTFGEMILMPSSAAYVADISPPHYRGRYMGAYHVTFSIAFVLGPWIGMVLLDRFGGAAVWTSALCAGCLSSAMLWRVTARREQID